MAGEVRQPIDIASLSKYLSYEVPEIKLPIQIKQARGHMTRVMARSLTFRFSLALGSPTLLTY